MGFGLGSLSNVALPVALTAVTGGASLALLAQQAATRAFATQLIQFAGNELGLPQGVINSAIASFGSTSGLGLGSSNFAGIMEGAGINRFDTASAVRTFNQAIKEAQSEVKDFLQEQLSELNRKNEQRKLEKDIGAIVNGKGSILMKIATIMGMIADNKMQGMLDKAKEIGAMGEISKDKQSKFTQMNAEMGAMGQEFSVSSQAMNTVIKTIGEAQAQIARKS